MGWGLVDVGSRWCLVQGNLRFRMSKGVTWVLSGHKEEAYWRLRCTRLHTTRQIDGIAYMASTLLAPRSSTSARVH